MTQLLHIYQVATSTVSTQSQVNKCVSKSGRYFIKFSDLDEEFQKFYVEEVNVDVNWAAITADCCERSVLILYVCNE